MAKVARKLKFLAKSLGENLTTGLEVISQSRTIQPAKDSKDVSAKRTFDAIVPVASAAGVTAYAKHLSSIRGDDQGPVQVAEIIRVSVFRETAAALRQDVIGKSELWIPQFPVLKVASREERVSGGLDAWMAEHPNEKPTPEIIDALWGNV